MDIMQAIVLGVIQGITEFLPVSSSGHLIFVPKIFGWADQGLGFDVVVHLGTLVAVIAYFRKRLHRILTSLISRETSGEYSRKLALFLVVSIIPAAGAGLFIEQGLGIEIRSAKVVAGSLIIWALALGFAELYQRRLKKHKSTEQLSWIDIIFISIAQAIALIPGTSRSGITMTAGLFRNLSKSAAAEFSFLMSIPVIGAAGLLKVMQLLQDGGGNIGFIPMVVGFVAAALSGYVAISWLMKLVERHGFMPFVVYRIIVGITILVFLV